MQSVTIGSNQAGQRLDKFLVKYFPQAGKSFLYKMLRKKNIILNSKKAEGSEILALGDEVKFFFAQETFDKFRGISGGEDSLQEYRKAYVSLKNITVLWEDKDMLVLNKPAGILTQKAAPTDISLNEWLIGYLLKEDKITEEELETFRPSVCNRLDRNTSGIVLCGKTLLGSQVLSRLIKDRGLGKYYHTICVGRVVKAGTLEGVLSKDSTTNKVTVRRNQEENFSGFPYESGEKSLQNEMANPVKINYRSLAVTENTFGVFSLLEVELITGKTHQIRAQLAEAGHGIVGDYKYGQRKINDLLKKSYGLQAQLLHAGRIEFPRFSDSLDENFPKNWSGLTITAPYPGIFAGICAEFGLTGK